MPHNDEYYTEELLRQRQIQFYEVVIHVLG